MESNMIIAAKYGETFHVAEFFVNHVRTMTGPRIILWMQFVERLLSKYYIVKHTDRKDKRKIIHGLFGPFGTVK